MTISHHAGYLLLPEPHIPGTKNKSEKTRSVFNFHIVLSVCGDMFTRDVRFLFVCAMNGKAASCLNHQKDSFFFLMTNSDEVSTRHEMTRGCPTAVRYLTLRTK